MWQQAENLLDAIAATNGSPLVYGRLSSVEAQMRNIDASLAMGPMFPPDGPTYEVGGDVRLFATHQDKKVVPLRDRTKLPVLAAVGPKNSAAA
jgi:hypothetical protein